MEPKQTKETHSSDDVIITEGNFFGVLDGVSAWSEYGIDPSIYPKQLAFKFTILSVYAMSIKVNSLLVLLI
jgi:hypothetical protein